MVWEMAAHFFFFHSMEINGNQNSLVPTFLFYIPQKKESQTGLKGWVNDDRIKKCWWTILLMIFFINMDLNRKAAS